MSEHFNPADHLIPLKGKDYLPVVWRRVWIRAERPDWSIETEMLHLDTATQIAVFRATIRDEEGRIRATGHGSETRKDFPDYIEKAETKAVGRALAIVGYGTEYTDDLDERSRPVDSPIDRPIMCERCGCEIHDYMSDVTHEMVTAQKHAKTTKKHYGKVLCLSCARDAKKEKAEAKVEVIASFAPTTEEGDEAE